MYNSGRKILIFFALTLLVFNESSRLSFLRHADASNKAPMSAQQRAFLEEFNKTFLLEFGKMSPEQQKALYAEFEKMSPEKKKKVLHSPDRGFGIFEYFIPFTKY